VAPILARLSLLDRYLPLWILLAMDFGLLLGRWFPSIQAHLDAVKVGQTSLPIALGLILMMYPVLAKVRYGEVAQGLRQRRLLGLALLLVWGLGPLLMFGLAWLFLPNQPEFRTGLIMIGIAHCHGVDLDRPGPGGPGGGRPTRRHQLNHPSAGLCAPESFLPDASAQLAWPRQPAH
jgi:ACR3 family arsenite efflux pump ArsB